MAHSIRRKVKQKPAKPREDFPLFIHQSGGGRWCKKVRGKHVYFGRVGDDPKGDAALNKWLDQKDDLLAGRTPRGNREGLVLKELVNKFLTAKESQRDSGDITRRSCDDYYRTCERLLLAFGSKRLVDDLAADDFEALRKSLAKQYGVHRLGNEVQRTRVLFKYGHDAGLIDKPMRYGPTFKKPPARVMRAHKQQNGSRMFEAAEARKLYYGTDHPAMRAMILLGINCGFGNCDCGRLPLSAIDLTGGWVTFPRPKTAIERRCPLWMETVAALREAIGQRAKSRDAANSDLVFITKYGLPWAKETSTNPVTQEFRKLLDKFALHSPGKGFYCLRHVFQTIADEAKDPVATRFIMGHSDSSMSGVYRERISDSRLVAVTTRVHSWLFPRPTVG